MWYAFAGSDSGSFVFKHTYTHTDHPMHFAFYSTFAEYSNASICK